MREWYQSLDGKSVCIVCSLSFKFKFRDLKHNIRAVGSLFVVRQLTENVDNHGWTLVKNFEIILATMP